MYELYSNKSTIINLKSLQGSESSSKLFIHKLLANYYGNPLDLKGSRHVPEGFNLAHSMLEY